MEANVALNVFGGVRDYLPNRAITRDSDDVKSAVVIVDGDVSARESLERLIRTAGWEPGGEPAEPTIAACSYARA